MAALRVKNFDVQMVGGASMYGLKNMSSSTSAAKIFTNLINKNRIQNQNNQNRNGIDNNILVFSLGDVDLHGLSWKLYLSNETRGIERSLKVFNIFLKEHIEIKGGYGKILLIAAPPPTIRDISLWQTLRSFNDATYHERIEAIASFNSAYKNFCLSKSYCHFIDITSYVWRHSNPSIASNNNKGGEEEEAGGGVFRPYVNLVKADVYGLMLEQIRKTLNANWCMSDDDDDDDIINQLSLSSSFVINTSKSKSINDKTNSSFDATNESDSDLSDSDLLDYCIPKLGFEPIILEIKPIIENVELTFGINVLHNLTPKQLVHCISQGKLLHGESSTTINLFMQALRFPGQVQALENVFIRYFGETWGSPS